MWHTENGGQVLKEIGSSEKGLSSSEARERLGKFGLNELRKEGGVHPLRILLEQFTSPLVIILIIAALVSLFLTPEGGLEAGVIIIIVLLNGGFGFWQEYKAEKTVEALKKLTTQKSVVFRDGKEVEVDSKELVPGDIVLIEEGTRIPADCRLLEIVNLKIDEASLTGESNPVSKDNTALKDVGLPDRKNMAYMGTLATFGRGKAVVVETGMETELGKISKLVQQEKEEPTPMQKQLKKFGARLSWIILGITVLVFVLGLLRGGILIGEPITQTLVVGIFITAVALAVAAIPEGLPAVVTVTLALGLRQLASRNALMRRMASVETLGSTTVICSDKTGTLTKNEMTVTRIWYPGKEIEVSGVGYQTKGKFTSDGKGLDPAKDLQLKMILETGALCNNAALSEGGVIGDTTEGALFVSAQKAFDVEGLKKVRKRIFENPFSSERKLMSTVNIVGKKGIMYVKGAPEVLLGKCTHAMKNGKAVKLTKEMEKKVLEKNENLASGALRVLGFAYKELQSDGKGRLLGKDGKSSPREEGLVFIGLQGMIDPPREEVKADLEKCKKAGIKVIVITGDNKNTALAIGRELGLHGGVLTGQELSGMSEEDLEKHADEILVYARVSPEDKLRIVGALKKKGHVVAMMGDGINDAPALKKADIGVAMGIKGTDVAKEASDMVLSDDNFGSVVSAIEGGRAIYDNIRKFILYLLSSNMAEVLIILLAMFLFTNPSTGGFILPLIAVQILWMNLITDGMPALALGFDPPAKDIMERLPRPSNERLLSRSSFGFIGLVSIVIIVGTLFLFWQYLPKGVETAQTMAFTTLVMFEMYNVFNARLVSGKRFEFLANKKLLLAIASSLVLQLVVIYVPGLQQAFGTVPLGLWEWAQIIGIGLVVLVVMWVRKKVK